MITIKYWEMAIACLIKNSYQFTIESNVINCTSTGLNSKQ